MSPKPTRAPGRAGYFAADSVIRRVGNASLVPLLGAGPSVLLQVAHPLVAAGVTEHSDFQSALWRRLVHTLRAFYSIIYGSREEADEAADAVRQVHATVQGRTRTRLGPFPRGTPYSANDPDLMLWVHATLVHVALSVYRRFVRQLSPAEEEAFYRQMALVAQLVGTPAEVIPSTLADFGAYMRSQLDGEELSVTAPAREVAAVILEPSLPAPLRPLLPVHRLATAGLLPARLRREYGLPWSRSRELALELGARSVRSLALPLFGAAQRSVPVRTQSVSESLFA